MKKLTFLATALASLFLAGSCQQQENLEPVAQGTAVKFQVEVPGGMDTKAIADASEINVVHYEIYKVQYVEGVDDADYSVKNGKALAKGHVPVSNKTADVTFDLLVDQEYVAIFWAQQTADQATGANDYYVIDDLRTISFKDPDNNPAKKTTGNAEDRAAFFRTYKFSTATVQDHTVTLYRPFAQLNLGTTMGSLTPEQEGEEGGYTIDLLRSQVLVKGIATSFNTIAGIDDLTINNNDSVHCGEAVAESTTDYYFDFEYAAVPSNPDVLKVTDKNGIITTEYKYVAMNYFFATDNVTVEYNIETNKGKVNNTVENVPVMENFRTNIIGNLLTSKTDFEIIVDPEFENEGVGRDEQYDVYEWNGTEVSEPAKINETTYEIDNGAELAWLAAQVNGPETKAGEKETFNGKTFVLTQNIDLNNHIWTPIGATGKFEGTFDGNGKTISNLKVAAEGKASAGLFANAYCVKGLTVDGAVITGHYKTGVIVGDGLCSRIDNCHVKNATVTVTPFEKDHANNVGGIVGYLSAENEAWVKNCTVENTTISAYRKVGGIAGAANQAAVVTGNTVKNTTIIADQIPEYKTEEDGNAGPVVGYKHSAATVAEGQEGENVTVIRRVDSTKELEHAVADAQNGDTIYIGGEVTMPYFTDKALNFEGITKSAIVMQSPATHVDKFYKGAKLNFKNLTLVGTEYKNDTQGYQKAAEETYKDCNFKNYIMFAGKETTVDNCVFTGKYNSYFWTATADNITFNECVFNGVERIVKVCTVGNNGDRIVTFNDCTFTATEQKKAAIEIDGTKGSSYTVNINGCTETGFAPGEFTGETMFNIEGMENVKVYVDGVLWKLRNPHYDVIEEDVDGNTIKTYQVYTADGLAKFTYMQNNVERDINLEIMNDIELPQFEIAADIDNQTYYFTNTPITVTNGVPSGSNWVAIGDYDLGDFQNFRWFYSNIEGNGYTISGLRMTSTTAITGFVGYIDLTTGAISNLNLEDAVVYNTNTYTAGLVGWMGDGVVVKDCHLTNVHISGDNYTGGIVGYSVTRHKNDIGTCVIENCSIDNTSTIKGDSEVGGIVGRNYGSIVKNSFNHAAVEGIRNVGGIVGLAIDNDQTRDSRVIACKNTGRIVGNTNVGGIVGESKKDKKTSESLMVACHTTATVAEYTNLLIGACTGDAKNYGSWGLKTKADQNPLIDGISSACYAFDSAASITQADIDLMNAAIDVYNSGRNSEDPSYCQYTWSWSEGNLPVLQ